MRAFSRAFRIHRPHEREYIAELVSIRKEIEFLLDFMEESPSNRTLYPVVEDFMEKEMLIERALRKPILPPLPDKLRNPFTRPRTPEEKAYIKELIKKYSGKRGQVPH